MNKAAIEGNWMQEFKDAWYSDNEIKNKMEKDEAWKEVERHANTAYKYIFKHLKNKYPSPVQGISKEGEERYSVQIITDANAPNGIHYRITDNNGDNRIATSYWKDHAEMICNALNAPSASKGEEQKLFTLNEALETAFYFYNEYKLGNAYDPQQYFFEKFHIDI